MLSWKTPWNSQRTSSLTFLPETEIIQWHIFGFHNISLHSNQREGEEHKNKTKQPKPTNQKQNQTNKSNNKKSQNTKQN